MKNLDKKEIIIICSVLLVCAIIVAGVVWMFFQIEEPRPEDPENTLEPSESMVEETPATTSGNTEMIIIPNTDGPVFFGVSSSISVDCVDPNSIKNDIIDKLFYMGFSEEEYSVTENKDFTEIKIKIENNEKRYEELYVTMVERIYSFNVSEHLENGASIDKGKENIEGDYSYLTINLYLIN